MFFYNFLTMAMRHGTDILNYEKKAKLFNALVVADAARHEHDKLKPVSYSMKA